MIAILEVMPLVILIATGLYLLIALPVEISSSIRKQANKEIKKYGKKLKKEFITEGKEKIENEIRKKFNNIEFLWFAYEKHEIQRYEIEKFEDGTKEHEMYIRITAVGEYKNKFLNFFMKPVRASFKIKVQ